MVLFQKILKRNSLVFSQFHSVEDKVCLGYVRKSGEEMIVELIRSCPAVAKNVTSSQEMTRKYNGKVSNRSIMNTECVSVLQADE